MRNYAFALLVSLFVAGPALAGSPALIKAAQAQHKKTSLIATHPVELVALNTHEQLELRPDQRGHFTRDQMRAFSAFLRCHHTGKKHVMAPRLAELLYTTAKHFEYRRILVVAGYRAPKIARQKGNPKSPHKKGVACDFRVEGVANTDLRDFLRSAYQRVGVGYYPNSGFIHLDVDRTKSAFWIDESGPGERARYVGDPEAALEVERDVGISGQSPREEEFDQEVGAAPAADPAAPTAHTPPADAARPTSPASESPANPWGNLPQPSPRPAQKSGDLPPPVEPAGR